MTLDETTPPLNEAELEALDGVLGEVTSDQVAEVVGDGVDRYRGGVSAFRVLEIIASHLADLYATADPSFDREEFLRRCGL